MIEAELKAVVRDPDALLRRLEGAHGPGRAEVYRDTYYDTPDAQLDAADRELRIREVTAEDGSRAVLLTFKDARVDEASGSKPEHETRVADGGAAHAIVRGLGHRPVLAFEKRCRTYAFEHRGRRMLATLVRVTELDGVFLEVETGAADARELPAALAAVRAVLAGLGISGEDLTTTPYTAAVTAARSRCQGK
ncbi:class IV adenylate cyclase [Kitasatospora sp. NPDC015120]|uniref:class IV adenylate cyclase n=1 Tax=Kitasatospora sp. NPDC015120 TaxID=3364023 RepID=UPI0036F46B02